jgi:hypothetical protein
MVGDNEVIAVFSDDRRTEAERFIKHANKIFKEINDRHRKELNMPPALIERHDFVDIEEFELNPDPDDINWSEWS